METKQHRSEKHSQIFQYHAQQYNQQNKSIIEEFEREISRIAVTMDVSEDMVLAWRFPDDRRRPLSGETLYKRFMDVVSIKDEFTDLTNTSKATAPIIGWLLTADFLDMLIAWRNAQKKRRGGVTGIEDN